jgi:hypothetical protein
MVKFYLYLMMTEILNFKWIKFQNKIELIYYMIINRL